MAKRQGEHVDLAPGKRRPVLGSEIVPRPRLFSAGNAIHPATNFFVEWSDIDRLEGYLGNSRWLLITGPWQSGKSSLMYGLADRMSAQDLVPVVTVLNPQMVGAANKHAVEDDATVAFIREMAMSLALGSKGRLEYDGTPGVMGLLKMLASPGKEIVWFIDEAALLNEITWPGVLLAFLSALKTCRESCVFRTTGSGLYCLRSFVLVGTDKTSLLFQPSRGRRIAAEGSSHVTSSPARGHDSYDPWRGRPISPLSVQEQRASDFLLVGDIAMMLTDYQREFGVQFRENEEQEWSAANADKVIVKLAASIHSLTSGYKGMTGCCCEYISRKQIHTFTEWKRRLRLGYVSSYVFYSRVYSRMASSIPDYPQQVRDVILECILTGQPALVSVNTMDALLPAINDGVLVREGPRSFSLTSSLLLGAMLEDCHLSSPDVLPRIDSFTQALQIAFSYINHERLVKPEVLNANGQPSEYIWQSEVLLSTKFVLVKGFQQGKYTVLVEAKKKDKNGDRRTRLDFLYVNSIAEGMEVQGDGDEESIRKHVQKTEKYGTLHQCGMHYAYLRVDDRKKQAVDVKAVIKREAEKLEEQPVCWFVEYKPHDKAWVIEQLSKGSKNWTSVQISAPANLPEFMFQARRSSVYLPNYLF
ncbi:hypothetical protein SELMODRAFT_428986 [Selaginella moellendorffii]|uniref:Uncharacterized protein n=1 Tax=Selaginella moellendorffii TaxID=88036 RepID=D8T4N8_SELML|nr:hypothetical protein SELMODRAFT_428986 [Selaginella moellendorffii]